MEINKKSEPIIDKKTGVQELRIRKFPADLHDKVNRFKSEQHYKFNKKLNQDQAYIEIVKLGLEYNSMQNSES